MKRQIDTTEFEKWTAKVGGINVATRLISERLECSISKAEKIAGGRYPSIPKPMDQIALAELMKRPRSKVFPVDQGGEEKAS